MSAELGRLETRFGRLAAEGRKALVVYATSGDPSPSGSAAVFRAALDAGADVVEIGVPFSDPTADGPAIQAASERALARGGGLASALADARAVRASHPEAGVVLFGYANPYLACTRGALGLSGEAARVVSPREMAAAIAGSGVDGVLTVDLPPEEDRLLGPALRDAGVHAIRLVTPVSTGGRVRAAAAAGGGFLYCVSVTGVTGAATGESAELVRLIARIRRVSTLPVVIGFGIAGAADAARLAAISDGVVVGSAVVRRVAEGGDAAARVGAFVRTLRRALDGESSP